MSDELAVVLGAGPVGRALVEDLIDDGQPVRVVTRSGTADVPSGVDVIAADISSTQDAEQACADAAIVYGCVGLDYTGWEQRWPPMMGGMLDGAAAAGARFVFMDNCYMYGPIDEPMSEDLPLTDYGSKPAVRSRVTRLWQRAHDDGRVMATAARASDFYGPGVANAALGDMSVGRLAQGKSAQIVGDPDQPHSFTYVPDIARALVTLGRADDDAYGEAWNVPNAPDRTMREVLQLFADELAVELRIQVMPKVLLSIAGVFVANMREMKEMLYQWEQPFHVDSSKFEHRFWSDPTPFSEGVKVTAPTYVDDR